jgi:hypothetical protein
MGYYAKRKKTRVRTDTPDRHGSRETHLAILPDLACDVITVLELIDEALTGVIEQETTDTTERLGCEELDLRLGLIRVDEAGRVHLYLLEIDRVRTNGHGHLVAVTGAVVAVGGGELPELGTVLLEERVRGEVGCVTAGGEDDRAVGGLGLLVVLVLNTDNCAIVLDELDHARLLDNLDAVGCALRKILKTLELGVSDGLRWLC